MPSWVPMGGITPSSDWQFWGASTQGEIFRVRHLYTATNWWRPRAIITQWWNQDEFLPAVVVYAKESTESLIELPIPQDYITAGLQLRRLGVKLIPPYRATNAPPEVNWAISIEVFDPN